MFLRRSFALVACSAALVLVMAACAGAPGSLSASPSPQTSASTSTSPTPAPTSTAPVITIDSPVEGATASVPVLMSGTADTFEAALTVDALDEAGDVICARSITATSGSGTPGTWETNLAFPPPDSDAPVTLRAYELSAKDGSMTNLVEREITVSAERPAITLTSPVCGATMTNPGADFLVEGLATVFEAALTVEFRDAAGWVILTKDLVTEVGNQESGFSEYVTLPADTPAGFYDVVAFDHSPKDGSIENEFSVQVRVRP